jgi:lysophospholipase L1-like esterase
MNLKRRFWERLLRKPWASFRTSIEAGVIPGSGGIAFLGDSLTHVARWDLMFPGVATRNFGISGERSEHLLARLEPLVRLKPQKIFVLIGSNDLTGDVPIDEIASNVDKLLEQLRTRLPECTLYLQGVMPRARAYAERIRALNGRYAAIAQQRQLVFIDLFPLFDDGTGQLRAEYTADSLHLVGAGYAVWRERIKNLVLR